MSTTYCGIAKERKELLAQLHEQLLLLAQGPEVIDIDVVLYRIDDLTDQLSDLDDAKYQIQDQGQEEDTDAEEEFYSGEQPADDDEGETVECVNCMMQEQRCIHRCEVDECRVCTARWYYCCSNLSM